MIVDVFGLYNFYFHSILVKKIVAKIKYDMTFMIACENYFLH